MEMLTRSAIALDMFIHYLFVYVGSCDILVERSVTLIVSAYQRVIMNKNYYWLITRLVVLGLGHGLKAKFWGLGLEGRGLGVDGRGLGVDGRGLGLGDFELGLEDYALNWTFWISNSHYNVYICIYSKHINICECWN